MERIEIILNTLHFCFYKIHYKMHLLFNRVNPFNLVHKLPFQKRKYEQLGINIQEEINKAFGDKSIGISMMVAGGIMLGALFFWSIAITLFLMFLLSIDMHLSLIHYLICVALSIILSYSFVFKNDKYLKYFKKFENWERNGTIKYCLFSAAFVVMSFLLILLLINLNENGGSS